MSEGLRTLLDGKYWSRSDFEHRDTRGLRAKQEPYESPTKIKASPKKKSHPVNPKTEEEKEAIRRKRQAAREALQKSLNAKHSRKERQAQLESRGFEIFSGVILGVRKTEIDLRAKHIEVQTVLNVGDDTSNHYPNEYECHHVPIKEVDIIDLDTLLKALNVIKTCYEANKTVLVYDRTGTRALAIIVGYAIAGFQMTFEQALDHVHKKIGNDLIELRDNFKPCLESWEGALGAVDNYDEEDDDLQAEVLGADLDMGAVEEDEPLPVEEEDMSMFSVDPELLADSTSIHTDAMNNNNTNVRKRKRSNEEEEDSEVRSNQAKKQKVDLTKVIKPELNQSTASVQISYDEDAAITINTTSLQISEEEDDSKAEVIIATKRVVVNSESKEEIAFDNQSVSSNSTTSMFAKFKFPGLKIYAKAFEDNGYDDLDYLIELVDDEAEFNKMVSTCGINKPGHIDQLKKSLQALKPQSK